MMRLFNVYFPKRTLLLVATEGTLIILSLAAAAAVLGNGPADFVLSDPRISLKIGVTSLIFIVCMYYFDLYDSFVLSNPREVTTRVIQVLGTVCLLQVLLYYVFHSIQLDQKVFLLGLVLVALFVTLWRTAFFALLRIPRLAQRAVLLGSSQLAPALAAEIEHRPELGIHLVGYVGQPADASGNHNLNGLRHLGGSANFLGIFEAQRIDRVIVAMADQRGNLPLADLLKLKTRGVLIEDGTDLYEAIAGKVPIQSLRMSWLVFSPGFRLSPRMLVYKRIFSIVLSLMALVFALPLMVIIAIAIRLDSRGPIVFRQKRMGRGGKIFTLYKFRSMREGADRDGGPHPALQNDPRVTRVGRWIRPPRLDELPQLYNILRGDMYFVGPRPFVPVEEEKLLEQIPFYAQRLTVKPGATGWAQVHRGYCATLEDNIEKLEYDLFYIKNASVGLDILTVLTTLKILLLGRGGR
jgi:sugar transferase (PEP-CTERM system associated)